MRVTHEKNLLTVLIVLLTVFTIFTITSCDDNTGRGYKEVTPFTPEPKTEYLTFSSSQPFSITPSYYENSAECGIYTLNDDQLDLVNPGILEYSTDAVNWIVFASDAVTTATSSNNGKLYIRGKGNNAVSPRSPWTLVATSEVKCSGNIMSLLDYENHNLAQIGPNCFSYLFKNWDKLLTTPELPATTLDIWCYGYMFKDCTSLEIAPALPATILSFSCYANMFNSCTSLKTAPALPAMTLASHCYDSMFYDCTSLETAPALPATTLAYYCYYKMFYNCTGLGITTDTTIGKNKIFKCPDCTGLFGPVWYMFQNTVGGIKTPDVEETYYWFSPLNGTISINGNAYIGKTLTAVLSDSSQNVTYQWYADSEAISGATGSSYTLTTNEENKKFMLLQQAREIVMENTL